MNMKSRTPIVITSINKPTEAILKLSKLKDFVLFVADDNETPKNWHVNEARFISIEEQHKKYPIKIFEKEKIPYEAFGAAKKYINDYHELLKATLLIKKNPHEDFR